MKKPKYPRAGRYQKYGYQRFSCYSARWITVRLKTERAWKLLEGEAK